MSRGVAYSGLAEQYDLHGHADSEIIRSFIRKAAITSSSTILEVGCGTANYIADVVRLTGCEGFGLDLSKSMIQVAKRKSLLVSFLNGTAESQCFRSGSFELVFSVDVIHQLTKPSSFFSECHRILKSKGKICTVTESTWAIRNRKPLSYYFPDTVAAETKRYWKITALKNALRNEGFNRISQEQIDQRYFLHDEGPYRSKTHSSLRFISIEAFERGLDRLSIDLQRKSVQFHVQHTLIWGSKT